MLHQLGQTGKNVTYEPELHPAAVVRFPELPGNAIAKVFSSGSVTLIANSIPAIQDAVVLLYPLLEKSKTAKPIPTETMSRKRAKQKSGRNSARKYAKTASGAGLFDEDASDFSDDSQCFEDLS